MSGSVHSGAPGTQRLPAPEIPARQDQRFPRTNKLLKHPLFDRVYQQGQRHFSGLMTVFFLKREVGQSERLAEAPAEDLAGGPRIGLTVGRVLGNSVTRNRIRRRMREAVRLNLHLLAAPVDVVINPKKAVLTAEFVRISEEVRNAFEAIGTRADDCRVSTRQDGTQPRPHSRKNRGSSRSKSMKPGGSL